MYIRPKKLNNIIISNKETNVADIREMQIVKNTIQEIQKIKTPKNINLLENE